MLRRNTGDGNAKLPAERSKNLKLWDVIEAATSHRQFSSLRAVPLRACYFISKAPLADCFVCRHYARCQRRRGTALVQ
jgi:hypothetical protein